MSGNPIIDGVLIEGGKEATQTIWKKYGSRIKDNFEIISRKIYFRKKILIVGGGEIGTEIGKAAFKKKWKVRSICCDLNYPNIKAGETPIVPIKNLVYYLDRNSFTQNYYDNGPPQDPNKKFSWTFYPHFDIDVIKEYILKDKPDVVLLEDIYFSLEEWKTLYKKVIVDLEDKDSIIFIPSVERIDLSFTDNTNLTDSTVSDIFLSKITMKEYLCEIGFENYLLGKPCDYVLIEDLDKKSIKYVSEINKINTLLKKHRKLIFKFESMSSGHGHFILSNISTLNSKNLNISINMAKLRIPNNRYVIEKFITNKIEVCSIIAKTENIKNLNRIYYKKDNIQFLHSKNYVGISRLRNAETKTNIDNALWSKIDKITDELSKKLNVPFLYVEYIIEKKENDPKIFINEVSYKPDDAGFITSLSHPENQFDLFIDSIEKYLRKQSIDKKKITLIQPDGEFICETIQPGKKFKFLREHLTWPYKVRDPKISNFQITFYEKYLFEKDNKINYKRITGYIWHKSNENGTKLLEQFKSNLDLDEEAFRVVNASIKKH